MEISFFMVLWIIVTIAVAIPGILILYCENLLPPWFRVLYKYGKSLVTLNPSERSFYSARLMQSLLVPKKYFSHFYCFAMILHMLLIVSHYFLPNHLRHFLRPLLDPIFGNIRYDGYPEYYLYALCTGHIFRRFCETYLICITSDAKINIIHYLTGHLFYISLVLFNANNLTIEAPILIDRTWTYNVGIMTFLLAQCAQLQFHYAYANLRRGPERGGSPRRNIISLMIRQLSLFLFRPIRVTPESTKTSSTVLPVRRAGYHIPMTKEFSLVSCPNYTAEIVIYTGLFMLTGYNTNFAALYIWVVVNQIVSALITHQWYKDTYGDTYPPNRRAIIPYIL